MNNIVQEFPGSKRTRSRYRSSLASPKKPLSSLERRTMLGIAVVGVIGAGEIIKTQAPPELPINVRDEMRLFAEQHCKSLTMPKTIVFQRNGASHTKAKKETGLLDLGPSTASVDPQVIDTAAPLSFHQERDSKGRQLYWTDFVSHACPKAVRITLRVPALQP